MLEYIEDAGLRKVSLSEETSIYKLESDRILNNYYIVSSKGTRRLMASPEVVGYDSYLAMCPATTAGLKCLKNNGLSDNVSILTILRGGLNYPLEECCHKVGIDVSGINFVSCERVIDRGVITGLNIKYEKLHPQKDCVLMIGDIIASGDTLRMCLGKVADIFYRFGGSFKKVVFFTVGGTKAIGIMERMTEDFRQMWPDFQGFECFFYEGIFSVYENYGVTGVNTPDIDFGWQDGIISPEFRSYIVNDPNAIFEKCIIYDGGARRYEIYAHIEEVLEYWNALLAAAPHTNINHFIEEKIGYSPETEYDEWLDITRLQGLPGTEELFYKEQDFIKRSSKRKLAEICKIRIDEFKKKMTQYK